MAEMSVDRACEVLQARKHRGLKWSLLVRDVGDAAILAEDDSGRSYYLHPDDAVAVAEKLEREAERVAKELADMIAGGGLFGSSVAAPPAERAGGQLFGNSEQLGRSVKNIRYLIEDLSDDDAVAVVEIAENGGYATIAAGHLRALLAAAERESGLATQGLGRSRE